MEYLQRVKEAKIEKDLFNVFANSMTKGYIRHLINIPSFFKRKTIEFRAYNNTDDFSEVENAILFSYKFIQYALTHTEEDFKQIDSFEKFQKALKFSRPLPKKTEPLIFSGNQHHPREAFVAKAKPLSSKMIKILSEQCSNNLACINPFLFHTELNMYQKTKITIYNVDEFNDIIYRIWKNKLKIKYCKTFDFLEGFNNETPARQITCLLLFFKMHKYARNTQYAKKELQSRIEKLNESLEKAEKVTEKLIHLFENSTYVFGTLYEALQNEENIFWQNGNNSKTRSVIVSLVKYSDYSKKTNPFNVSYYGVLDGLRENQKFMFVSENAYFKKVNKIAKQGKSIFYSSQKAKTKITQKQEKQQCISIEIPPNDLDISNHNKLKIIPVKPSEFSVIQREYVKKVHKTSGVYFSFLVFYENYCLGGFGFNFPKGSETNYDLWLLSDFSTNNQVFRLSKLILLCIQSQVVKKILQRKTKMEVNNCYTKVYTNQPVSMKYRGVFKKVKLEKESVLMYETDFGLYKENQEIIKAYQKMKKNNEK
ncbi:hypothetical protein [Capnocytophaga catalasegens]|uniref:TLDc domain-containing protein n=1 Tax=Capnocytophaga catalasegens TaxID=1004260 RepID=A0AAV5ARA7_9FLAO|nr:hypothetical protein [Capnocytophaga catalasegens]GIZ15515.1 hypothetical protein RCZ03_15150 [Capnocytophaga catalasegens]GJM49858.1 hypothetical protein RCZ15_08330 [Capnocytophaga catalasegens]GJM54030.1 hypothetical protein RCZ16_23460 [Capnocytophaga catalasegens]